MGKYVLVPRTLVTSIVAMYHESEFYGHLGVLRTMALIKRDYVCSHLRHYVECYILSCDVCQAAKSRRVDTARQPRLLRVPDTKWHSVSIDWVSGLPPTTRGHDAIMTLVDRFSKRGMSIPCRKDMTADDRVYLFLREVIRLKRCPRQILSDRDKLFESEAWKELAQRFKIEMHQTVANRPRGNGLAERSNQSILQCPRTHGIFGNNEWVGCSPTLDRPSFRVCGRGPLPTGCGCGGCGRGDPPPTPERALLRAAFARCGDSKRAPGGGRLLPGCGASGVGRSPTPDCPSFGACGRGPLPTGCGCGGRKRGDPSPNPQRALLRAGFARCGGGTTAPGGGASCLGAGRPGFGRSPSPDRPSFGACGQGPLPTGCGCRESGRGDPSPTPQRALLRAGFARCGGGSRAPWGDASCLGVGCPGSGALPPPTAGPLGRAAGAHHPLAAGAGGAGVGTRHQPHSARSCELALRAVEAARGHPGGAPRAWLWGVRGRALSHPRPPVLWDVRRGPTTHWLRVRGVRAFGPVTNPTARALASWLCALWGRLEGTQGGASCLAEGRPGLGALPSLTARPLGRAAGARHPLALGAGGAGLGTRHQRHSARSCEVGFARCGGGWRAPGGGASCLAVGRRVSGATPPPAARPSGRAAGAHYPLAVGAGGTGVGTRHQPHSARSCELALRAVGAARGHPGGAPIAWLWGVRGRALSHPRPPVLWGVRPGPTTHWLWVRGMRAWGLVTYPTARALVSWLCTLWGWLEGTRGGRLLPGCGASGVKRSPTPDRPSSGACDRGPLPTGCGCGVRAWGPGCPWHLLPCRGSSCFVRASRVCGTGWPLWIGTCPLPWLWPAACLSGVPRGPALVRRTSSGPVALGAPVGFPVAVVSSPIPGAVAPGFTGWLRGARGGRPRTGLFVPAAGPCRGRGAGHALCRTRSGPRNGVVAGGSLGLRSWGACASVVACADPVTDASGFPYRWSFDGELGRCTGAVSCGRRHLPFRVGGRHASVPRVCACACFLGGVRRAGLPGAFRCASPFLVAVPGALFVCLAPVRLGSPCLWFFLLSSPSAPPLSPAFRVFRPWVPWALASCAPPPVVDVFFPSLFCAPLVSGVPCYPALGALGLGVSCPPPCLWVFFPLFRAPLASGFPCFPALGALGLGA